MGIISRNLSVMWNEQLGTDTSFGTKERRLTHFNLMNVAMEHTLRLTALSTMYPWCQFLSPFQQDERLCNAPFPKAISHRAQENFTEGFY